MPRATARVAPTALTLDTPLAGSGLLPPAAARRLGRLGLRTVRDLLFHLPRRYDDFSRPRSLRSLREDPPDDPVSSVVTVVELHTEQTFRRRVQKTTARLRDGSGEGEAVWFGRRFVERRLAAGQEVALSGRVTVRGWLPQYQNPDFGPADGSSLHAGRIVPVYRLTAGVSLATLRRAMRAALDRIGSAYPEYLAADVLRDAATGESGPLPAIAEALESAHYPADAGARGAALARLAFDELLALQVGMVARDRQRRQALGRRIEVPEARLEEAEAAIEGVLGELLRGRAEAAGEASIDAPKLTRDQVAAVGAIRVDLGAARPMLRLLQGDVGSGKTAVAALALAFVADSGSQGALLAPTDLLARQHAVTLAALLEPLGHRVELLTASLPAAQRRVTLELIGAPPAVPGPDGLSQGRVVVGTHALVSEAVAFADLALAIIDEQHRFGVAQREALSAKGTAPHVLLMTATPIPRTLGQVFHADLDVSDLRAAPAGRLPITTGIRTSAQLMQAGDEPGQGTWPLIARETAAGHRAFVIVPLIEEDVREEVRSVDAVAELLEEQLPLAARAAGLPPRPPRIGRVHGQLRAAERDLAMERFRAGELEVLVGTTVLEVGVDVPEATVMVILDADRFGVAQLHQLRGRVGRGSARSYCVLVSDSEDLVARARLGAVAGTQDGFELAERDLELRSEGELLGLAQSGLPPLRVARLQDRRDRERSVHARAIAERLVRRDGTLEPGSEALARELASGWLAQVGAGEVLAQVRLDAEVEEPAPLEGDGG
jgi:ATP-dependent DNA helicase RecG